MWMGARVCVCTVCLCVWRVVFYVWDCNANQWSPSVQSRIAQCLHTCPSFNIFCSTSSSWVEKKNRFSSQSEGWKQSRGVKEVCLEAQILTFLFPCQEDHGIRSAVTKLGEWRLMLLDVTSIALEHYLSQSLISLKKDGERGKRNWQYLCTIMHRRRIEI